jgi:putative DNA primase/helicase
LSLRNGRIVTDTDFTQIMLWLGKAYSLNTTSQRVAEVVDCVARDDCFHPVRDYLGRLQWDGTPRLDDWLTVYLGVPSTDLASACGRAFLISCVARAMKPGCKVDTMLVLVGPQGGGKSSALACLVGETSWFMDGGIDFNSKDGSIAIQGRWLVEFSELESLSKASNSTTKAFLTRQEDKFRPPYGRVATSFPRQCVFAGTTNEDNFIKDATGSRRFWAFRCGVIDLSALAHVRNQLWAEASAAFDAGEDWWLTSEMEALRREAAEEFHNQDPWTSSVAEWAMSRTQPFTIADVLTTALSMPLSSIRRAHQNQVGTILRRLGYTKRRRSIGGVRQFVWTLEEE